MKDCCDNKANDLSALREKQAYVLKIVLLINVVMFFVEAGAGIYARSTALLADSADMLGDAVVYAITLFILHRSERLKIKVAFLKAGLMLTGGLIILVEAVNKWFLQTIPHAETMGAIGALALVANLSCLWLLYAHRSDDINLRSTWRCSRNDIIANSGVLVAAALVGWTNSLWPDLIVGLILTVLFTISAAKTVREASVALKLDSRNNS